MHTENSTEQLYMYAPLSTIYLIYVTSLKMEAVGAYYVFKVNM